MRDMTVLRQIAVHLDGWSDLRARVATEDISWPSVHLARVGSGTGIHLWQCVRDRDDVAFGSAPRASSARASSGEAKHEWVT